MSYKRASKIVQMIDWDKVKEFYGKGDPEYIQDIVDTNDMYKRRVMNHMKEMKKFVAQLIGLMDPIIRICRRRTYGSIPL